MSRRQAASSDSPTLSAYLRAIARIPLLSPEAERELASRVQQHGDWMALTRLVEANLRFVVSYAKRYRGLGVPLLDLIHEGNVGLIEAARRFDPLRHGRFLSYAAWWVREAMVHAVSDGPNAVSVPPSLSAAWRSVELRNGIALSAEVFDVEELTADDYLAESGEAMYRTEPGEPGSEEAEEAERQLARLYAELNDEAVGVPPLPHLGAGDAPEAMTRQHRTARLFSCLN